MKVKQQPNDFCVEELTDVRPGVSGPFAFYRLEKTGWTTPDALDAIRRRWQIELPRLGYGGLKDRHAVTTQYITIHNGPRRNLQHERVTVTYVGQVAHPYSSTAITANRFAIVLRHLTEVESSSAEAAARELASTGVPNYFDDQRFGSVGPDGRFVARELVGGRFEEGLKIALAGVYEHDGAPEKAEKAILLKHWNDWPATKAALPRGNNRSIVDYLVSHPVDYKGAVVRLRPELQGLYLSAYQSHIWNRMLDRWLTQNFAAEHLGTLSLKLGSSATPTLVTEELERRWKTLHIPLPSARWKPEPGSEWAAIAEAVLSDDGLTLAAMKVPGVQKPFFSKGERTGCVWPTGLATEARDDELNRGRKKLLLRFDLPRGCYATMVIKRITGVSPVL